MAAVAEDRALERGLEAAHVGQLGGARGLDGGGGPVQHRLEHPECVQDRAARPVSAPPSALSGPPRPSHAATDGWGRLLAGHDGAGVAGAGVGPQQHKVVWEAVVGRGQVGAGPAQRRPVLRQRRAKAADDGQGQGRVVHLEAGGVDEHIGGVLGGGGAHARRCDLDNRAVGQRGVWPRQRLEVARPAVVDPALVAGSACCVTHRVMRCDVV